MSAARAFAVLALGTMPWTVHAQPSAAPAPAAEEEFELSTADPKVLVGAPRARPLVGAALDERTEVVAGLLRCPVCQGLSVADSRAGTAVAMKEQVRELLAAGYDQEQVLSYFERSYGGFVRLEPPLRGINWLVWLAPAAGLLLGGLVVWRALRPAARPRGDAPAKKKPPAAPPAGGAEPAAAETAPLPARDTLPEDGELARYVRRVREIAYGWPDGEPPRVS